MVSPVKFFKLVIDDADRVEADLAFSVLLEKLSQVFSMQDYTLNVITFDAEDAVLLGGDSVAQARLINAQPGGVRFTFQQVYSAAQKTEIGECCIVFLPTGGVITDDQAFVVDCADDNWIWIVSSVEKETLERIAAKFNECSIFESTLHPYFLTHFGAAASESWTPSLGFFSQACRNEMAECSSR